MFGSNACYIVGVKLAGATAGAIWQSAQPLFITLMAVAVGFEQCSRYKAVGVVMACGGCVFVSTYGATDASGGAAASMLVGNGLFLVQLLCVSTFWVSQKPLLRQFPPLATLAYAYGVATLLMSATASAFTADAALLNLTCADCPPGSGWEVPRDAWLAILYWVFLGSVLAYFLNTWGNTRVHASIVGIYGSLQPIVTILASEIIIVYTPPPHYGLRGLSLSDVGALAILAGLALVVWDFHRAQHLGARGDDAPDADSGSAKPPGSPSSASAAAEDGHAASADACHAAQPGSRCPYAGATASAPTDAVLQQRLLAADGS